MRTIVLGWIFGLVSTAAAVEPGGVGSLHPGRSRYFLRAHGSVLDTHDELNDDRHGPTESRGGWRAGLRTGWEFRGRSGGSPVGFCMGMDLGFERRTMVGVIDDRSLGPNPYSGFSEGSTVSLVMIDPAFGDLALAWESARPYLEQQMRQPGLHHLNSIDVDLSLGFRAFPVPGDRLVLELRTWTGLGIGTLAGHSTVGWRFGGALGAAVEAAPGLRLGLEVGYSWRGGKIDHYDADHRGRALQVGGSLEVAF